MNNKNDVLVYSEERKVKMTLNNKPIYITTDTKCILNTACTAYASVASE